MDKAQKDAIGLTFCIERLELHTPYGVAALKAIEPYKPGQEADIERCFDNIERLIEADAAWIADLGGIMAHFLNIRGIVNKCANIMLNEVELFEIKGFLINFENFIRKYCEANLELWDVKFLAMTDALDLLDFSGRRLAPFALEDELSPKLGEIRREKARLEAMIAQGKGAREDLLAARTELVAQEDAEETRIMRDLSEKLAAHSQDFFTNMDNIGKLDLLMAKARFAAKYGGIRPAIGGDALALQEMHNPAIAETLGGKGFTKISLELSRGATVITGANMGGKSVVLKTALLNAALARLGFFVFAQMANIPIFDNIYLIADIGEGEGLSSFGAEMSELNRIIPLIRREFALLAIDEPARTTNPAEGAIIARAIAEFLSQSGSVAVLTTHYDAAIPEGVAHYQVAGISENLKSAKPGETDFAKIADYMDYRLIVSTPATPIPKDAITICRLIGLDKELMGHIENQKNNY